MPGLEVTMAQGVRLWNIGADDAASSSMPWWTRAS
jgi:hypothetical protein